MTTEVIGDVFYELFVLVIQLAGPMLVISMLVGIIISILQAATQIHEQTLTFLPKLLTIGIVLVLTGGTMLKSLQEFTLKIFRLIEG